MALCAPPPAPVGGLILRAVIVLAGLGCLIVLLASVSSVSEGAKLLFAGQMLLFAVSICSVPTVAHRLTQQRGRVGRVLLETILFMALFVAFSLWLFGTSGLGIWIGYATGLILVLEVGGHFIERYMVMTLKRVFRIGSLISLQSDAETIRKIFRSELVLYVSVPLGLSVGTIIGLISNWTIQATIVFTIQVVLSLASLVLLVYLVGAYVRMSDPLFRESKVISPRIAEEAVREKGGILSNLGKVLRFLAPPPQANNKENQEQQDLSLAHVITDLRKVYLYDSVHNVILLVAFAAIILVLRNIIVDTKWIIATLIGLGLAFGQLPYIIGQSLLHEKVLDRYEGVQRSDIADKLKKTAPLFPTIDFLAALFTTGTAGGMVYFLFDQIVKEALK